MWYGCRSGFYEVCVGIAVGTVVQVVGEATVIFGVEMAVGIVVEVAVVGGVNVVSELAVMAGVEVSVEVVVDVGFWFWCCGYRQGVEVAVEVSDYVVVQFGFEVGGWC